MLIISHVVNEVHDELSAVCFLEIFVFGYILLIVMLPLKGKNLIVSNFFVIIPTRCTNFTDLFCHESLHVSDSSSFHRQGFIHCTLSNGICHTGL